MNIHFSLTNRPSSSSQVNVQRGMYNSMLHHQKKMLAALHAEKMKRQEIENQKALFSKREHELEEELARQKELAQQRDLLLQHIMKQQQQQPQHQQQPQPQPAQAHQEAIKKQQEHARLQAIKHQQELAQQEAIKKQQELAKLQAIAQQSHHNVVLHNNAQQVNSSQDNKNVQKKNKFNSLLSKMNQQKHHKN